MVILYILLLLLNLRGGTWTGSLWHGLNGAVLYSRSQDGGNSWDIDTLVIPGMDTSSFLGFSADDYAIAAQGETVVIAYFNAFGDSFHYEIN